MDKLADFLQAVGYHAVQIQPLLPMNAHLILSALFPIYTGAHASLSRPASAAKPPKRRKQAGDDDTDEDEDEDSEQKMEGMTPLDAIMLPALAGCTLAGLYFIIKWLEDPAILNTILNWYFSVFGVLALARSIIDVMTITTSIVSPRMYTLEGEVWKVDGKRRRAQSFPAAPEIRESPLPGRLSTLPLPKVVNSFLWTLRELPSQKLHIRFRIHKLAHGNFKIGPQGLLSFAMAVAAQIYFNLIDKPWWLTNALGLSLAYNALQILSPTTSWTGTLILCALFLYDIYFVFFTPLMVTVATKLDIPAKLVFPRPSGRGDDPAKQALSMLGLGDIVLPGMMIGFALRFDLYLFYLRKQTRRDIEYTTVNEEPTDANSSKRQKEKFVMEKDKWYPATGGWGERFWTSRRAIVNSDRYHGIIFPKTYFHSTLLGYVVGMLVTLGNMQIFHHAQPALLYLVPGVLGALWGTAFINGDIQILWMYTEAEETDNNDAENEKTSTTDHWNWPAWRSLLFGSETAKTDKNKPKDPDADVPTTNTPQNKAPQNGTANANANANANHPPQRDRDRKRELISFSVTLPNAPTPTSATSTESDSSDGVRPEKALGGNGVEEGSGSADEEGVVVG